MATFPLTKVLDGAPGVKKEGATFIIAEEVDANAFVSLGQEMLQLQRLSRVEIADEVTKFQSHSGEVFYFPIEQVVGFKFGSPHRAKHGAGFR
jgi:hypothetical protein